MIADPELVAAVDGRAHWSTAGAAAVYAPPGSEVTVRVQRVLRPARRERYMASVLRAGVAASAVPCRTVEEAVKVAERIRPVVDG